jgi:glycosyltransferase involved in cell wall biosynthesis
VRVLHVIHDYLPRHRAGSELYVQALCRAQRPRHEVRVLCAEYDTRRRHGSLSERLHDGVEVIELVNNWRFRSFEESWRSPEVGAALAEALDRARPEVVHVHNLLDLSLELPALARARGAAVVATLHDYTPFCPSGGQRVHVAEEHVCRTIDVERCARCFAGSVWSARMSRGIRGWLERILRRSSGARPEPEQLAARLEAARRALEAFDVLVAPSKSLAAEYAALGAPRERIEVSDYGLPPLAAERSTGRGERLRIGYVGTPIWHKGVHVLLEAAAGLPDGRWDLDVWGDTSVAPAYSRRLRRRAEGLPVRFRGAFGSGEANDVYAALDVLVVPSLWLENSPLVVHEAFLAGVPVVAARIGGLADLVEHERSGLLYEPASPAALRAALLRCIREPGLLERLAAARPAVDTIAADAERWDRRYARAVQRGGGGAG